MGDKKLSILTRLGLGLLLILCLTACATLPREPSAPIIPWKKRQIVLNQLKQWQVNGKIAFKTPQDAGSAIVAWLENQGQYQISLSSPFGTEALQLTGGPGHVIAVAADGKHYSAKDPEALILQQWGFRLPVSALYYWIRGLPVPHLPYQSEHDDRERLANLTQLNWHIQYLRYSNTGKIDLPDKIFLTSQDMQVKILIYQWQPLDTH